MTSPADQPDQPDPPSDARCPLCGYDLRGQVGDPAPRCPECGRRFEWADFTDPARRRHPYLFEHHPRRPTWSFARTIVGGLRPGRFWGSLSPTMPSAPRRLVAYWAIGAAALVLAMGQVSFWAAVERSDPRGSGVNLAAVNLAAVTPLWRYPDWPADWSPAIADWFAHPPNPSRPWELESGWGSYRYSRWMMTYGDPWDTFGGSALPLLLAALAWPWLTRQVMSLLRQSVRLARVDHSHVTRAAVYAGDAFAWGGFALLLAVAAATLGEWVPILDPVLQSYRVAERVTWAVVQSLWPAAGALYLVAVYRLFVAYRQYLRLPHAAGVVVGTQAIVLLVLVGLHVAWWTLAQG